MNIKKELRRGFTLIELMIVIVILGILMGTILPRLTGAQSRARDTARIADLNNISQALEVYFSDSGKYPNAACTGDGTTNCGHGTNPNDNCLDILASQAASPVASDTYNLLKGYLKGDRVPQNVGKKTTTMGCEGSYWYSPLKKGGTLNGSYILASDLETWQMSNYNTDGATVDDGTGNHPPTAFAATTEAKTYIKWINKLSDEPLTELDSIYIVIP